MRLAKPNGTERPVPYNFSWLLTPKSLFGGKLAVLEVNFGAAYDFFTKNDQKRQIKAVLSIFENSQKWTPHLRLGFWLSCAQIACFGPKMGPYGANFCAEPVFWPKMTIYVTLKLECETFNFFNFEKMKWKNGILCILGRLDRFCLVQS